MKPLPPTRLARCRIDGLPHELRVYARVVMVGCPLDHVLAYDGPRLRAPAVSRPRVLAPTCWVEAVRAYARAWSKVVPELGRS